MNQRWFKFSGFIGVLMLLHMMSLTAQTLPVIRISVENTLAHVQTQAVQRFATRLAKELASRYEIASTTLDPSIRMLMSFGP